ncbi:MAG TPA: HEAT repeat domain-containing protein [Planctomycetota bacterium]|nr:HEAT repeat domain-containing protein [Planctomycetota bacterium]
MRTALQFVAIPLLIVGVAIGLYVGLSLVFDTGPKSASDFVEYLRSDTINRRWQAAYELAARLGTGEVPDEFRNPDLVRELCRALDEARKEGEKPPRRAILVLAILRRLGEPSTAETVRAALDDPDPWISAHAILTLGALKDEASRARIAALARSDDPGTRQASLEALSSLDQVKGMPFHLSAETREVALEQVGDAKEDVRFTAALVLADAGERAAALPVLRKMLDRSYLERFPFDDRWGGLDDYRLRSVILLKAIDRAVALRCGDDPETMDALRRLADDKTEGESEVREAARKALEKLQPKTE